MTGVTAQFASLRPLMFKIAYRMTGSVAEAEDLTQDAFLKMMSAPAPNNPEALATTVTTRLAIDHLRSARVRREEYVGEWLPTPLIIAGDDPAATAELHDELSLAFLLVLERLSPTERAAFLLREVFGYSYSDIAVIIEHSVESCRQLVARGRARLAEDRPRFEVDVKRRNDLAAGFLAACRDGDLTALERMLAEDVVFHGDGGGKVQAIARPVHGRVQVARFILGVMRQGNKQGVRLDPVVVNGQPGFRAVGPDGATFAVLALQIVDGHIQDVFNQLNPDKLLHI